MQGTGICLKRAKAAFPSLAWDIRMASTQSRNRICKLTEKHRNEKQSIGCSPDTEPAQMLWQKQRLKFFLEETVNHDEKLQPAWPGGSVL